jgi:hypothetical protein
VATHALIMPVAWLLNFDADRELAMPGYTPSSAAKARMSTLDSRLLGLVRPGDVVVRDEVLLPLRELHGLAWCPTPRALVRLERAGAIVPPSPDLQLLRRVNSRRFCAELGQTLPHAAWVDDLAELAAIVARPIEATWCLKRPFSASGSGRRLVTPGALTGDDAVWANRAIRDGLQVEPWVEREGDFAQHGHVSRRGEIVIGRACSQRCTRLGQWLTSEIALPHELNKRERALVEAEALGAGRALAAAGYFGPFNVDAFRYRWRGQTAFNPRCEINARYTMGWAVGMGTLRPDLEQLEL